ncbi:MAG: PDZ domain-containing protein [Thermoanaerobaculia bacterium]|nr:MAG: PDZ domain-containing protein [Thermoanaerobaculia bacterium]MBZ0102634.1 PDZ domain-containing protein [Thermoanaerobaculia bacterium]
MRSASRLRTVAAALLAVAAVAAPVRGAGMPSPERVAAALAVVYPALVNLTVVNEHFADGRALRGPGAGSGVIVSADGHVLTNYHVAGDATRITATLTSGEILDAEVVAHDPSTDLSVLRLRLEARDPEAPPLRPARFSERPLEVGDPVLAMGNPLTLSSSVTLGIVSNSERVFTDFLGNRLEDLDLGSGGPTGLFTRWIQHDALILPGNSGGPLVDLDGGIVGINELGGGGIGFAIPTSIAREVLAQALELGRIRRAWLGLSIGPVSRLGREDGALINSVVPGSPAEQAGVEPGDILLAVGETPVAVRFFPEVPALYLALSRLEIDAAVELAVERSGERLVLRATPGEMEEAVGRRGELRRLGITAQEVTGPMALGLQIPPRSGLLVTSLRAGFPAVGARPPVEHGDLITAVGERPVATLDELRAALEAATGDELLLALRRDEARLLSVVRLREPSSARWGGELPKAWLGVRTQVVTPELARAMGQPDLRGFRVTEVYPWTAAARGGLRIGDVIVAVAGEPVEASRAQDVENLRVAVERRSIGEQVAIEVARAGETVNLDIELEASPRTADEARTARQAELEFGVRDLTFLDRIDRHLDREQGGVIVTEVTAGGWAQMGGLESGDLIVAIDDTRLADVATFEETMRKVVDAQPEIVPVFVRRGWRTTYVFLEPEWAGLEPAAGVTP